MNISPSKKPSLDDKNFRELLRLRQGFAHLREMQQRIREMIRDLQDRETAFQQRLCGSERLSPEEADELQQALPHIFD